MNYKLETHSLKYIFLSSTVIFLIGTMFHFLYDLLGRKLLIGLFVPVNESVWEHCKMVILPTILWWLIYYIFANKMNVISIDKWLTSMVISLLVSIITIPLLFYFYTQAFGVELIVVDIIILFIAILSGQSLSIHYYIYSDKCLNKYVSLAISIIVVIIFMVFTVYTPKIPIFMDSSNQSYGIEK